MKASCLFLCTAREYSPPILGLFAALPPHCCLPGTGSLHYFYRSHWISRNPRQGCVCYAPVAVSTRPLRSRIFKTSLAFLAPTAAPISKNASLSASTARRTTGRVAPTNPSLKAQSLSSTHASSVVSLPTRPITPVSQRRSATISE